MKIPEDISLSQTVFWGSYLVILMGSPKYLWFLGRAEMKKLLNGGSIVSAWRNSYGMSKANIILINNINNLRGNQLPAALKINI